MVSRRYGSLVVSALSCFLAACTPFDYVIEDAPTVVPDRAVASATTSIVAKPWEGRFADDPSGHWVSLPPGRDFADDIWTYQFGASYASWPVKNMECGPASVSMIEKLAGRPGTTCTYQAVVADCPSAVHSNCRMVGDCGHFENGFLSNSSKGTVPERLENVLKILGHATTRYAAGTSKPLTLQAMKQAILADHPIVAAVDVCAYKEELGYGTCARSHYVVVYGFSDQWVYILDPGYKKGQKARISTGAFMKAIAPDPSAVEVTRPNPTAGPTASWYPPGTLLHASGEYYLVGYNENAPILFHASQDALKSQRLSMDRAIEVSPTVLGCFTFSHELDPAVHYREYRNASTGTIYLVDLAKKTRHAFLSWAAYQSWNGVAEWQQATQQDVALWKTFPEAEPLGLAPGMLFGYDTGDTSTTFVVTHTSSPLHVPIADATTAHVFGYPIDNIGGNPRVSVQISKSVVQQLAGSLGESLREELARDCAASHCVSGATCFTQSPGGGDELVASETDEALPVCSPMLETCNGVDDDCNGAIDEGFDLASDDANCGACAHACLSSAHCLRGSCVSGGCSVAADCDDGYACTTDVCVANACVHMPHTELCAAGSYCQATQGCLPTGVCVTHDDCQPALQECVTFTCVNGLCHGIADDTKCTAAFLYCDLADNICKYKDSDKDGIVDEDDCAPFDPTRFPGNPELCNGIDDNCAAGVDEPPACPSSDGGSGGVSGQGGGLQAGTSGMSSAIAGSGGDVSDIGGQSGSSLAGGAAGTGGLSTENGGTTSGTGSSSGDGGQSGGGSSIETMDAGTSDGGAPSSLDAGAIDAAADASSMSGASGASNADAGAPPKAGVYTVRVRSNVTSCFFTDIGGAYGKVCTDGLFDKTWTTVTPGLKRMNYLVSGLWLCGETFPGVVTTPFGLPEVWVNGELVTPLALHEWRLDWGCNLFLCIGGACELCCDTIDNDGDSLADQLDPDCTDIVMCY